MINVSNAFKNELYLDRRNYLEYADITLSDGTELPLTNKDFWQGGMSLDDAVSGNDAFEIGAAIVNSCSLTIENIDDRFSEYDFLGAKVVIYVGLNLPDGKIERVRKGTYTVNDPKYNGATISLNCQDNMAKFDRSYSESELTYPATLNQIVRDACSTCDVTLQTLTFSHSNFVVQTRPTDEAITFREVISWAAQIAGCFCRCDVYGRLELKWYDQKLLEKHGYDGGIFDKLDASKYTTGDNVDGGTFNPWSTGDVVDGGTFEEMEGIHHIYSHYSAPVISTDDVVITGVRVLEKAKEQDEETGSEKDAIITYQSGTDGYVVSIEDNELIQGGAGLQISNWLGEQLIGFRFRKASLSHASDPTIEAGDVAIVTDRKQNTYPIIVSSTRFSTGSAQSTESSAETPARNSAARFSAQTKNYVEYRKDIQRERTEREKAQEELKERIDSSSGLYTTEETQPDESTIFYMHDKPTLEESKIVWKMTAEAWGVSTDGGDTYNAGMTVDGNTIVRILTAVGVNADWIKTGALRIEKNGKVIFLADADTKRVEIVADEFSLSSGGTIDSIAEGKANTAVNDFVSKTYDPKIAELQKQLDGQIESFYYNYAPSLSNEPASNWETEAERAKHEGDLFYDKSTGYAYRFFKEGTSWKWQMIQDTDITKALENAAAAQDTADHKRRVFVDTPQPPYDVGDLWVQGENGDILRCQTAKSATQNYASGDWVKASKYTDDSALKTFINDTYTVKINELETQADKKAETWYQSADPSTSWTSAEKTEHTGDLWYNTSDQKTYIYSGSGWEETKTTPPDAVFDQIDGKAQIFINTPTAPYHIGDLWFNSATSDIMTCIKDRTSGNYTESEWQKRNKYTDNTELANFITNTYEKEISALEQQADKKAETWYQGADPSGSWTAEQKTEHKGDIWYNTSNQKTYIYNGTGWDETKSTPPQEVFDQIDGKAQIFINTPTPPYHRGDLWFQSATSDIMTCITERLTGDYTASDWQKRNDYIDQALAQIITNNALSEFLENEYRPMLEEIKNQADKKSENWYQEKDPLEEWIYLQDSNGDTLLDSSNGKLEDSLSENIKKEHTNDLWYNTKEQKIYYWDGAKWNLSKTDVPDELFDTIDGKAQVFISTPVPPYDIGDLWYGGTNSDVKVCTTARESGNYVSTDWTKQDKYIDQTAANKAATDAVNGQTQESVFNKLTNNGESKGIYLKNGQLYVNATYLQSGAIKVAKNGRTLFLADIDTGKVEIVADSFSLSSGETIDSIAEKTATSIASESVTAAINNFVSSTYNPQIAELQKQLDGQIETHFYDHVPTLDNEPAVNWKTEDERERHEGDLFFNRATGYSYRFFRKGNTWDWELVQDTDVTMALAQAAQAQATADGKARVFYRTPQPPYDLYDLWAQGTGGDIMICVRARQSGDYDVSDWAKSNDYIDRAVVQTITNNALSEFFESEFQPMLDALKEQADKKSENWYQEKNPLEEWIYLQDSNGNTLLDSSNGKLEDSSSSNIKKEHTNDLWYNTTEQKIYYWDGTKWNLSKTDVPDELFDKIDGKAQIFISQPKPPYQQGDLWFDSATSDIMTCIMSRESGNYLASDWQKRNKYIDQSAANKAASDAVEGQTQESIFNKITENGTKKTFKLENGEIYLNATYIQSGALKVAKDGRTIFLADMDAGRVDIVADTFSLSSGKTIDSIAEDKAQNAVDGQTQDDIFNKLTNSGNAKGIVLKNKQLYVSATYINTGTFKVSKDEVETFYVNVDTGEVRIKATSFSLSSGESIESIAEKKANAAANTALSSAKEYTDKTATDKANAAVYAQTQESIFNKLTDNGKEQGIYLENEKIYLNAEYLKATYLSSISANLGTVTAGKLQSNNYNAGTGNFSSAGTLIDLSDGIIKSKQFAIDSSGNAKFKGALEAATGTFSGSLSAATGSFSGTVTATSGKIGPWTIADIAIYNGIEFRGNKNTKSTGVGTYGSNWAFWAGDGRFTVDQDGNLSAQNGVFGGSLNGATGTFSGTLSAGSVTGSKITSGTDDTITIDSGTITYKGRNFTGPVRLRHSVGNIPYNPQLDTIYTGYFSIDSDYDPIYITAGSWNALRIIPPYMAESTNGQSLIIADGKWIFRSSAIMNIVSMSKLDVSGTKRRIVKTDNYETRGLYCYETPSPLFGDIGEAITDENGECYIYLDDIFSETVSAQIEYQVFLQKEGPGDIWIAEKTPQYFVVQGTENLKFAWEIKAKQRDYEYERLEKYQENEAEEIDYEQQYLDEIEMLIKEQEEIYYETA